MKKQLSVLLIAVMLLCASIPCFADSVVIEKGAGIQCEEPVLKDKN